ncbi:MAG TPA: methyltransferase [Acidimicrobiales bacterium]|nr:methyltransferase [Acidimicrobiales bacterium]
MAEHYFTRSPSAASRPSSVRLQLPDHTIELATDRGVFSADRVDPGTLALLKTAGPPPPMGEIVDLGCGYGAIACAIAKRSPGARVWAVEVNERARDLAAANAKSCGATNVAVVSPEAVPVELRFAAIYSNPPIRIGKDALHSLLSEWLGRLEPAGAAWLVVNRHLGGDSLATWLGENGFGVQRAASKSGYRVMRVSPNGTPESAQ